jgi:hypothetical protein
MSTFEEALEVAVKAAVLRAHPVGSYFITESADNPSEIFGGGYGKNWKGGCSSAQVRHTPWGRKGAKRCIR